MTKLSVWHNNGEFGTTQEVVVVGDDEEYWFENHGTVDSSLAVGPRWLAPWSPGVPLEEIQSAPMARPRLHIFNLARVEVVK